MKTIQVRVDGTPCEKAGVIERDGRTYVEVPAYVYDHVAVHRPLGPYLLPQDEGWTVTHLRSGLAIMRDCLGPLRNIFAIARGLDLILREVGDDLEDRSSKEHAIVKDYFLKFRPLAERKDAVTQAETEHWARAWIENEVDDA